MSISFFFLAFEVLHLSSSYIFIVEMFSLASLAQGTEIIDKSHDQDTTDLHKCVTYIRDFAPDLDKSNVC